MSHLHGRDGIPSPVPPAAAQPPVSTMYVLLLLTGLLMTFSVAMWMLNNVTLAAGAGMGAIALVADIARRLLATPGKPADGPPATRSDDEAA